MVAARDLKCGNDVAKMAALGRYAEEFIVYAVSYQQDGKVWHRVSSNQDEIWRLYKSGSTERWCPLEKETTICWKQKSAWRRK